MGKLVKELILTVNLHGLTEAKKMGKETDIANAHQANPTIVPNLTPVPAVVLTMIGERTSYYAQRDALKEQLKEITAQIHAADANINNIFVTQWRPQTQVAIAGDESKAKLLGYGIKGQDTGHTLVIAATEKETIIASHPNVSKIDVNVHEQHTVHIINNISGKRKLPAGILRIEMYGYTGAAGLVIADLAQLLSSGGSYLGQASKGKYVNVFTANTGKTEYYVAVYIDKKTKKPVAQSPVASAIIN